MVLNEEESHEGGSVTEHGPNLYSILDSDPLWIALSLNPLLSEGEHSESIEFVTDLLWAHSRVDFTYESSATPKVSLNVVVQCSGCVIFLVIFFWSPEDTHY